MTKKTTPPPISADLIVNRYAHHPLFDQLKAKAEHGTWVDGLTGSAPSCVAAALFTTAPLLVIAEDADKAGYFYSDLTALLPGRLVEFFPSAYRKHIKYGHADTANEMMRAQVSADLRSGKLPLIVTYPEALAEAVIQREDLQDELMIIKQGDTIHRATLREQLFSMGFTITDYVFEPGQAAFRGSIVDIYSYHDEYPLRLDFFDDEVESIRFFDVQNQLSLQETPEGVIVPPLKTERTSDKITALTALLPTTYRLWVSDPEQTLGRMDALLRETPTVVEGEGFQNKNQMDRLLISPQEVSAIMQGHDVLMQRPSKKLFPLCRTISFSTTPQPLYHKNYDLFISGMKEYHERSYGLYLLTESSAQMKRLQEILSGADSAYLNPAHLPITLHEGFEDSTLRCVFLADHMLFDRYHKYRLRNSSVRNAALAVSLEELTRFHIGDYIVHTTYGIAQFGGLGYTQIGENRCEIVKLIFRDGDVVAVGLHSLHKLAKYRGKSDQPPVLSKLGSSAWSRIKEHAKKKIKDIARDLIALYAARKEKEGFAFSPDSYLQHELEASFMYEDTPDQVTATEAIKKDMESKRPMDRLVCGDVGFGKTEVAIRAAFKAVADSKQVAVLVPTTILAYQHYRTFTERLEAFPCTVAYLSRARSAKDAKAIREGVAAGRIDIVIGTQKILAKDFKFKDLGLLIIDEEQKFGVTAKEKLRTMQVNVDTLTLSATPIPRTLQFSLMGARDLSNITTPPKNRLAVRTRVIRFSPPEIKEAIEYELSRNGQVYIVHNRIHNIFDLAKTIEKLVPGARIAVGHGRMNPAELEKLLLDFSRYEYDVLVATSIIENGIDVPNANTIMVNNAQDYGLSDLHQIRGRVGRSNKKAFCYLITPPLETLPGDARRRIQAIESAQDLGSGMRIAMQDLDIRGAGNIFGAEQSGFIADLGFETYKSVFEEAVREVKLEEYPQLFEEDARQGTLTPVSECVVETDIDLSFPPDYVPQDGERIALYRRIDSLKSEADREAFTAELTDRFGAPIPNQVQELLLVPQVRRMGLLFGIEKITIRQGRLTFFLPQDKESPFYESKQFDALIAYVSTHPQEALFKETGKGNRLVLFPGVTKISLVRDLLNRITAASHRT